MMFIDVLKICMRLSFMILRFRKKHLFSYVYIYIVYVHAYFIYFHAYFMHFIFNVLVRKSHGIWLDARTEYMQIKVINP